MPRGRRARGFAAGYVAPAIKANAVYGGGYPLFTALGRPLIAELAVEYARRSGCDTIAHGCTGKGNDQVRIEATVATLAPELKIIAPGRRTVLRRSAVELASVIRVRALALHGVDCVIGAGPGPMLARMALREAGAGAARAVRTGTR